MNWKPQSYFNIPEPVAPWLLHRGSFMQRLLDQGIASARIEVIKQVWDRPLAWEQDYLRVSTNTLIREVLILTNQAKLMFARSLFPAEILTGQYADLANLQNRSLGSLLFNNPQVKRSDFDITQLSPESSWRQAIEIELPQTTLWARRSTFAIHDKKLLLSEVFLPDLYTTYA